MRLLLIKEVNAVPVRGRSFQKRVATIGQETTWGILELALEQFEGDLKLATLIGRESVFVPIHEFSTRFSGDSFGDEFINYNAFCFAFDGHTIQ